MGVRYRLGGWEMSGYITYCTSPEHCWCWGSNGTAGYIPEGCVCDCGAYVWEHGKPVTSGAR